MTIALDIPPELYERLKAFADAARVDVESVCLLALAKLEVQCPTTTR